MLINGCRASKADNDKCCHGEMNNKGDHNIRVISYEQAVQGYKPHYLTIGSVDSASVYPPLLLGDASHL